VYAARTCGNGEGEVDVWVTAGLIDGGVAGQR
jgi:hypothetical protein